jgi:hypothetical protein
VLIVPYGGLRRNRSMQLNQKLAFEQVRFAQMAPAELDSVSVREAVRATGRVGSVGGLSFA